mmetsp:Transcript_22379/g.62857  ORF Transcript_22379/g.62857 Transcript_22379/m.62857 type:complete len:230 (+) Transcript_22379:846-1535(+)
MGPWTSASKPCAGRGAITMRIGSWASAWQQSVSSRRVIKPSTSTIATTIPAKRWSLATPSRGARCRDGCCRIGRRPTRGRLGADARDWERVGRGRAGSTIGGKRRALMTQKTRVKLKSGRSLRLRSCCGPMARLRCHRGLRTTCTCSCLCSRAPLRRPRTRPRRRSSAAARRGRLPEATSSLKFSSGVGANTESAFSEHSSVWCRIFGRSTSTFCPATPLKYSQKPLRP